MRLPPLFYDVLYQLNAAPWDKVVRPVLVELVESGRLTPQEYPSVIDLGCGSGAEVVYLATKGFTAVGVDFSSVGLRRSRQRARAAGVSDRCEFHWADLSTGTVPGPQSYDLVCDFGALDDLQGEQRQAMAGLIRRLVRPGGKVLLWCFQADKATLPRTARMMPMIAPGEEKELFGDLFDIEYLPTRPNTAMLLMTRRIP